MNREQDNCMVKPARSRPFYYIYHDVHYKLSRLFESADSPADSATDRATLLHCPYFQYFMHHIDILNRSFYPQTVMIDGGIYHRYYRLRTESIISMGIHIQIAVLLSMVVPRVVLFVSCFPFRRLATKQHYYHNINNPVRARASTDRVTLQHNYGVKCICPRAVWGCMGGNHCVMAYGSNAYTCDSTIMIITVNIS